jgi:hypothetical protein
MFRSVQSISSRKLLLKILRSVGTFISSYWGLRGFTGKNSSYIFSLAMRLVRTVLNLTPGNLIYYLILAFQIALWGLQMCKEELAKATYSIVFTDYLGIVV